MLEQTQKGRVPAISKRVRAFTFATLTVAVLAYVGFSLVNTFAPRDHLQYVSKLQGLLPTLAKYKVQLFQRFSVCHALSYARGQFASPKTKSSYCYYKIDQPFDTQAESDFGAINAALSASGLDIESVDVVIGDAGDVRYAEFRVKCMQCGNDRYAYALDTWNLPGEVPNNLWHPQISQNWYLIHESWN